MALGSLLLLYFLIDECHKMLFVMFDALTLPVTPTVAYGPLHGRIVLDGYYQLRPDLLPQMIMVIQVTGQVYTE